MTTVINQDSLGNTYLNAVNSVGTVFDISPTSYNWADFFTAAWGDNRNVWTASADGNYYAIRLPSSVEQKTGTIPVPTSASTCPSNARFIFRRDNIVITANSNNSTGANQVSMGASSGLGNTDKVFAVANEHSLTVVTFSELSRVSLRNMWSVGWFWNSQYTGVNYPRNFYRINGSTSVNTNSTSQFTRINIENNTTVARVSSNGLLTSPDIDCVISTPGADTTNIPFRDLGTPFNYIGKLHNLIQCDSVKTNGRIYRINSVLGSDNNFWMSVGNISTSVNPRTKYLLMPVWTENIT